MSDSHYLDKCWDETDDAGFYLRWAHDRVKAGNPIGALCSLNTAIHCLAHAENWWELHKKYEDRRKENEGNK